MLVRNNGLILTVSVVVIISGINLLELVLFVYLIQRFTFCNMNPIFLRLRQSCLRWDGLGFYSFVMVSFCPSDF